MRKLRAMGRAVAAVSLAAAGVLAGAGSAAADQTLTASPLQVTFVQSEFATHYKVDASDSAGLPITYAWTFTPPTVDPACNNYGNLTSSSNEFIWRHGDQDHCDHTKQGALGHLGVVSVVVSDASSRCTGSYGGTEGANGSPTASVPLTCTAIAAAAPLTASTAGTPSSAATPTAAVPSTAASATATVVHTSSGGGLQWIVVVLIAVGLLGLGLVGWRWRRGHDPEQDFVYPDYSPGCGDDPVGRQPLEPPVLPPLVGPLTPPVVGVVTTDDPLDTDDDDTDCSQLRTLRTAVGRGCTGSCERRAGAGDVGCGGGRTRHSYRSSDRRPKGCRGSRPSRPGRVVDGGRRDRRAHHRARPGCCSAATRQLPARSTWTTRRTARNCVSRNATGRIRH